jgi:hypothetical protein
VIDPTLWRFLLSLYRNKKMVMEEKRATLYRYQLFRLVCLASPVSPLRSSLARSAPFSFSSVLRSPSRARYGGHGHRMSRTFYLGDPWASRAGNRSASIAASAADPQDQSRSTGRSPASKWLPFEEADFEVLPLRRPRPSPPRLAPSGSSAAPGRRLDGGQPVAAARTGRVASVKLLAQLRLARSWTRPLPSHRQRCSIQ